MTSEHPAGHEVIAVEVPGGRDALGALLTVRPAAGVELIAEAQS